MIQRSQPFAQMLCSITCERNQVMSQGKENPTTSWRFVQRTASSAGYLHPRSRRRQSALLALGENLRRLTSAPTRSLQPCNLVTLIGCCLILPFATQAAEPWSDDRLPIKNGLEVWLDVS